jgi:DNA gyrase/topoisomerase IV subunit B
VFVNALVENPSFDSQTKETLTTRPRNFGSDCQLSNQFLETILEKTRIVDTVRPGPSTLFTHSAWFVHAALFVMAR